ncbi:hypothetical protein [Vreelandella populi]|uniref:Uncharacterized protein n=1 Tax=Vreelandella populi TaxID=2498858 RepID=A0A433LG16_9GAMM|nr:hypothetical protein [Halomonas populi]RUR48800.1 hypothetical protein ELY37_02820 [Halomonas populi]
MSNYTQWGKNVIFCGPAQMLDQANRKESPVAGEYLPGTVVHYDAEQRKFVAGPGSLNYVLDKDHLGQGFIDTPYQEDDVATAFWPQSALVYNLRTAAGLEVAEDDALYIGADGVLTTEAPTPDEGEAASAAYGFAAETITTGEAPELVAVKFI